MISSRVLLKVFKCDDREGFSLPLGPDARMSDDGLKENEQFECEEPMVVKPITTRRCSNEEMIAREMRGYAFAYS